MCADERLRSGRRNPSLGLLFLQQGNALYRRGRGQGLNVGGYIWRFAITQARPPANWHLAWRRIAQDIAKALQVQFGLRQARSVQASLSTPAVALVATFDLEQALAVLYAGALRPKRSCQQKQQSQPHNHLGCVTTSMR